jgi:MFS family permease
MLELLDDCPLRAAHYRLWLLSSGGTLLNGMSLLLLGVAIPLIVHMYGLDPSEVGLVGAALVFGAVPGSLLGGKASDRFGRRTLYLADMAIVACGGIVSTLAVGPWTLFAGQLVVGCGIGIDFPVAGAYVAEIMPRTARARMMVATIAFQGVGMLLGVGLAIAALAALDRPSAWRGFMVAETACAVAVLFARLDLSESPRWLVSRGRNVQAGDVVARLVARDRRNEVAALAASAPGQPCTASRSSRRPSKRLEWESCSTALTASRPGSSRSRGC